MSLHQPSKTGCQVVVIDARMISHSCGRSITENDLCKLHNTVRKRAAKKHEEWRKQLNRRMKTKKCPTCNGTGEIEGGSHE